MVGGMNGKGEKGERRDRDIAKRRKGGEGAIPTLLCILAVVNFISHAIILPLHISIFPARS
jgi:hypothetical protein